MNQNTIKLVIVSGFVAISSYVGYKVWNSSYKNNSPEDKTIENLRSYNKILSEKKEFMVNMDKFSWNKLGICIQKEDIKQLYEDSCYISGVKYINNEDIQNECKILGENMKLFETCNEAFVMQFTI